MAPTFDADGNMLDDGAQLYVWDGENRLTAVKRKTDQSVLASYTYDHQSRRIAKATTAAAPQGAATTAFLYDGWNVIAEYNIVAGHANLTATNLWGTDLSGSQQGAGGVGGLLVRVNGGSAAHYAFDANGNVTELFDSAGSISAHYEYGPFGEPLRATGAMADSNPFRFSTKYQDNETGLLYYGYRYYSASNGRWLSRDPIQEKGGPNLYGFVGNAPTIAVDYLGMDRVAVDVGHSSLYVEEYKEGRKSGCYSKIDFGPNLSSSSNFD